MKDSKDLLSSVVKTTQMGQVGIRCVMKNAVKSDMKKALKSQLKEYNAIEQEAQSIASARGWQIEELDPAVKYMAGMMTRARLMGQDLDSKIAAMMIQGNTRGTIKTLKNLHRYQKQDKCISDLSQRLLDCETENIRQMQGYL